MSFDTIYFLTLFAGVLLCVVGVIISNKVKARRQRKKRIYRQMQAEKQERKAAAKFYAKEMRNEYINILLNG